MEKALAASVLLVAVNSAPTVGPTERVQAAVEQVLGVVQNSELRRPGATDRRRREIRRVVRHLLDLQEMARRSLAQHWGEQSPKEREEFVRLFTSLLERAYVRKLEGYSGERIVYTGETVTSELATVHSKVITARHGPLSIDYRLHRVGSHWAVYDLLIEGVSLVSLYRSQFNRIIRASSYAGLIERLKRVETNATALDRAPH